MTYRISFGNGQVSETFDTYAEAREALRAMRLQDYSVHYRIQRYDGEGEWVGLGKAGRLTTSESNGL